MKRQIVCMTMLLVGLLANAQEYKTVSDISYTTKTDVYAQERLKLDVYYPEGVKDCPVVLWFHGGGIEAGQKEIPEKLKGKGYVVIGANYRLLPKVTIDKTLDDAAEAVAWVFRHAEEYGGDPNKIVVTGHSAGGYAYGYMLHSVDKPLHITMSVRCRVFLRCSLRLMNMHLFIGFVRIVLRLF